jgi:hypothetical protein
MLLTAVSISFQAANLVGCKRDAAFACLGLLFAGNHTAADEVAAAAHRLCRSAEDAAGCSECRSYQQQQEARRATQLLNAGAAMARAAPQLLLLPLLPLLTNWVVQQQMGGAAMMTAAATAR